MNYVILPIAHGVEFTQIKQSYAAPLVQNILKYLTEEEKEYFLPLPYNYTLRTDPRQVQMFKAVEAGLGNQELRRLKHTVGSDVTWSFIVALDGGMCFYRNFFMDVSTRLDDLRRAHPNAKVVCVGHSQGTQNFYSFFFEYASKIDCFISMGSPISMNSGAYEDWGKVPKNLGSWINLYNDMDFVSSTLQDRHPSKAIADFVTDVKVPLGWNPLYFLPNAWFPKIRLVAGLMAHVMYWKSDFVAKVIAKTITDLMHKTEDGK